MLIGKYNLNNNAKFNLKTYIKKYWHSRVYRILK